MTAVTQDISSTDTLTAAKSRINVLLAAGGTGGHVYPAIAIADALGKLHPQTAFLFVGTRDRMEWETVPKYGYDIKSVWISGFHRRLTLENILFPIKLVISIIQSFLILKSFKPDAVIACGGFASGPVGWVAAKLGIPLFLQEQNSFPGVTNRMLAKHAAIIFTAFEDAETHFPSVDVHLLGNPVRSKLRETAKPESLHAFSFTSEKPVLLILGGSGGAKALNSIMQKELKRLHDELRLQIIWQCGEKYLPELESSINTGAYPNLRLTAFIEDMPAAYGAADLVVTRAGAGTCSELMNIGKPAVLVPSPNVAGNHQEKNARSLTSRRAAELLPESELEEKFYLVVNQIIQNPEKLAEMSAAMKQLAKPFAAKNISNEILTFLKLQNA